MNRIKRNQVFFISFLFTVLFAVLEISAEDKVNKSTSNATGTKIYVCDYNKMINTKENSFPLCKVMEIDERTFENPKMLKMLLNSLLDEVSNERKNPRMNTRKFHNPAFKRSIENNFDSPYEPKRFRPVCIHDPFYKFYINNGILRTNSDISDENEEEDEEPMIISLNYDNQARQDSSLYDSQLNHDQHTNAHETQQEISSIYGSQVEKEQSSRRPQSQQEFGCVYGHQSGDSQYVDSNQARQDTSSLYDNQMNHDQHTNAHETRQEIGSIYGTQFANIQRGKGFQTKQDINSIYGNQFKNSQQVYGQQSQKELEKQYRFKKFVNDFRGKFDAVNAAAGREQSGSISSTANEFGYQLRNDKGSAVHNVASNEDGGGYVTDVNHNGRCPCCQQIKIY